MTWKLSKNKESGEVLKGRIMNDYGHIDDSTPSFVISLYPQYRGWGIGTAMMRKMLAILKECRTGSMIREQ